MALTRAKKAEKVTELAAELESSTSAIVGTFAKLTVAQDYNLRKVVREAGGNYRVLKNKLAGRASKGTKVEAALQGLKGVSSVAYTSGDPVALTKAISTWVERTPSSPSSWASSMARSFRLKRSSSWPPCRARMSSSRSCSS